MCVSIAVEVEVSLLSQKVLHPTDVLTHYFCNLECDAREIGMHAFLPIKLISRATTEDMSTLSCDCEAFKMLPVDHSLPIFLTKWCWRVKELYFSWANVSKTITLPFSFWWCFLVEIKFCEHFYMRDNKRCKIMVQTLHRILLVDAQDTFLNSYNNKKHTVLSNI